MMRPRVWLNHCWTGHPQFAWYPWLRTTLAAAGYDVDVPQLPDPDHPDPEVWQAMATTEIARSAPESTWLVGHSLGACNVLRFLQAWGGEPFAGVVLVAPVLFPLGVAPVDRFVGGGLDLVPLVPARVRAVWALISTDDPYLRSRLWPLTDDLVNRAGAGVMVLGGRGHFSESAGCREVPELVSLFPTLRAA